MGHFGDYLQWDILWGLVQRDNLGIFVRGRFGDARFNIGSFDDFLADFAKISQNSRFSAPQAKFFRILEGHEAKFLHFFHKIYEKFQNFGKNMQKY